MVTVVSTLPSLEPHPCSVSLAGFEGPLDLLLHLVEQARLDITAISLVQVTGQYLAYMRAEDRIDHRALADFVVIGARLIELKSRALLPVPPPQPAVEDEPDPADLVALLREYQRFKEVAVLLRGREEDGMRGFPRLAPAPDVPSQPGLNAVTLDRLMALVQRALTRGEPPALPEPLRRPTLTVRKTIDELAARLRLTGTLSFAALIERCNGRDEVIVTFFAVLELVKRGRLIASQRASFGEIVLTAVAGERPEREPDELSAATDLATTA